MRGTNKITFLRQAIKSDAFAFPRGVAGLNSAAGFIQSSIAKKMRIRQFPKLQFIVDSGMKSGFKMVQTLNQLEAESKEREQNQVEE